MAKKNRLSNKHKRPSAVKWDFSGSSGADQSHLKQNKAASKNA